MALGAITIGSGFHVPGVERNSARAAVRSATFGGETAERP
jgi:hypothetical protein